MWNSGAVASDDPFAEYGGPALGSRTRYFWSVRVGSEWAAPTWFETAYLRAADWKGDWIAGPDRITRPLTYAEGAADDACCLVARTTLSVGAAAGDTNVKVDAVNAFTPGAAVTLGAEPATVASVGTPTTRTTLGAAAAVGATSIRVADITWLRVGDRITVDAGESAEDVTIASLVRNNFGASTVNLAGATTKAHANGAAVYFAGSGITLGAPTGAHAAGAALAGTNTPAEFCRPPGTGFGPMFEGACREIRPEPLLRKAFTLETGHGDVVKARLYSVGLAYNNISLYGTRTSDRVLDPGFTRYSRTVQYTTDDVAALLRPGTNVLATRLGSGRVHNETTSNDWHWEDAEWRGVPRLRADLIVTFADGTEQVIRWDETWKVQLGPTRFDAYYLGETYDARREIAGWETPGFDASAWPAVRTVPAPTGTRRDARGGHGGRRRVARGHAHDAAARRARLRHRPAARGLGDDQGHRRARGHADPGPLRREAQPQRHGDQLRLHRRRPDPDRLLHRQGHGDGDVHAPVHLQGLPVHPGELAVEPGLHAAGQRHAVRGEIASSWEQVSGGLKLDVKIPPNATGVVYVPGTDPAKVGEVGSGIPLVAGRAPGVTLVGVQGDSVVYRVTAGVIRVPGRAGRVRLHRRDRDGRRHGAGDALVDARHAGDVRRVHAGRGEGVHGVHDGQRDLHGR